MFKSLCLSIFTNINTGFTIFKIMIISYSNCIIILVRVLILRIFYIAFILKLNKKIVFEGFCCTFIYLYVRNN